MKSNERPKNSAILLAKDDEKCLKTISLLNKLSNPNNDKDSDLTWIPLSRGKAKYELQAWLKAIEQLIWFPEQSSSSILRADIISESNITTINNDDLLGHLHLRNNVQRILLPRRPNLDASLKQKCEIYTNKNDEEEGLAILTPILENNDPSEVPFYHPKVRSIAFHFCSNGLLEDGDIVTVTIYFLPFPNEKNFNAIKSPQDRLSRTSLSLIELQSKIAWGVENGYKKRVEHDLIIPKKDYQELYMQLRDRYASLLINTWCESTDPKKHVFEDLGIVAFIILLWKSNEEPPQNFVDIGCGNGLLVYLLTCEGFKGYGIDVQARKSWDHYKNLNKSTDLKVQAIDAPGICLQDSQSIQFPKGSFLIGNHADELTSWLPLLAQSTLNCSGFINIPCCKFDLDGTISSRSKFLINEIEIESLVGSTLIEETMKQIQRGPFAESDSTSRNIAYLRYISNLHLQSGWQLEKEALRIPSTKNWAFIGRKKIWQDFDEERKESIKKDVLEHIQSLAQKANEANWKARISPTTKVQNNH